MEILTDSNNIDCGMSDWFNTSDHIPKELLDGCVDSHIKLIRKEMDLLKNKRFSSSLHSIYNGISYPEDGGSPINMASIAIEYAFMEGQIHALNGQKSTFHLLIEAQGEDKRNGNTELHDDYKYEMCKCGHFGGHSPDEQHESRFQKGHGQCKECSCEQFTWVGFCNSKGVIV